MVISQVHLLLAKILELESIGVAKETIRAAVSEVRKIHAHSPIIARMQNWPRGHTCDYEIILSGRCVSQKGRREHWPIIWSDTFSIVRLSKSCGWPNKSLDK